MIICLYKYFICSRYFRIPGQQLQDIFPILYIFGPLGGLPLLPAEDDNDRFGTCCPCGVGRKAPDL